MSLNLVGIPTANFEGTPYSQPIQIGNKPPNPTGPKAVRLDIPWATYGAGSNKQQVGVFCNLTAQGNVTGQVLDAIRSVYIDNTYVEVPVYIKFPDTLFTIVCPAFSVVMAPVFTNVQQFTIYGDGFIDGLAPVTSVFLSNIDRQGFYIPAAVGGNPDNQVLMAYHGFDLRNPTGNFTINNVNIGEATDDRLIVAVFEQFNQAGFGINPNTIVMGGVGATLGVASTGNPNARSYIVYANVPAGTTMNVTVDCTNGGTIQTGVRSSFYSLKNLDSFTPTGSASNFTGPLGGATLSMSPIALLNGAVIGGAVAQNGGAFSWQNLAQDQVGLVRVGSDIYASSASVLTNTSGPVNISCKAASCAALAFA